MPKTPTRDFEAFKTRGMKRVEQELSIPDLRAWLIAQLEAGKTDEEVAAILSAAPATETVARPTICDWRRRLGIVLQHSTKVVSVA